MSNKAVQPIGTIARADGADKKPTDPVQAEFEEGKEFLEKREFGQAAVAFHNVLKAHEEKNNQEGIANAAYQLGHVCLEREEFELALSHYQRAWDIIESMNDPMSLFSLSTKLVEVHRGLKNYRKAIDISLDLIEKYNINNNPEGTVNTLEIMADIYLESGDKQKAADALRTIASIHSNFRHKNIAKRFEQKAKELAGKV